MRRILVLVFVLLSIQGFAQPSNYSWYKQRTRQYSFMADSAMYLPRYNGTPSGVRSNESSTISGMVGIDTTNHRQYFRSGSSWRRLANYTELGVDSIWRVAGTDSIYYSKQGTTYKIKDSAGVSTNIYNSDGTLSGTRTVTTGGNEINFYTDASNYFKYVPSTQGVEALMTNGNFSSYLNVDAGNGIYMYGKNSTVSGNGGFVSAYSDGTELELSYNSNITGLLNNYKYGNVYSLLATENPYVGLAIDSVIGTYIGKGISVNDHRSIRGFRVLPDWQIYMDSIDAGGTANDSVLVVQSDGKVLRRNASAFGGSSYTASNGLTLSGSNFKLGGTLSEATSIAAAGYNFDITNSSQIELGANEGGNVVLSSVNGSDLTVGASININPHLGELFIDTLDTFSDTTNFKPLVYRASTGKVERANYWPVGSGGGTPAGNFGNLQINRNGAFATPGSDSLDWESSTGLTVTGGTRTTTLGVNKAAPTATYAAEIASDGTYTTNLKLSNTGTPTSFLTLNSVYGDVLSVGSLFKGSEFLISQSDGIFGISQGANQIARFTASDGMYAGRRWQTKQGADVASAAGAITLGGDGNVFEITGTSSITLIANTNWQNGATVTLLFTSTATLTDGTANSGSNIGMELAGNANFTATADDVLTLVLSEIGGTQRWREVSRSVN